MTEYHTRSGRVLTDADNQALADEAERGYDVDPDARPGPLRAAVADLQATVEAVDGERRRLRRLLLELMEHPDVGSEARRLILRRLPPSP
jgi:hypothetical protein